LIDEIARALRERWGSLGLQGKAPKSVQVHLDSSDPRDHGFVTFRAFRSGDPAPICVGRIPRDGLGTRDALHEHDLLASLGEEAPRVAGRLVPRPLFVVERGARIATARTVMSGEPLTRALERERNPSQRTAIALRSCERWLAAFARATGLLEGTEGALWEPFLRSIHFERRAVSADDQDRLDELSAAIDQRRQRVLLCGFGHGALQIASFRIRGDRLGVTDWEHGRTRQAPWVDPIHFALDLALRADAAPADAARRLRDPHHPLGAFVRDRLEDVGVPADLLALAIPAVALAAAHRVERDGPDGRTAHIWRQTALAALVTGNRAGAGLTTT